MTHEEIRDILAMRGAELLLDEADRAENVAIRIYRQAERITGSGSTGLCPMTMLERLEAAEKMLSFAPTYQRAETVAATPK